MSDQNFHDIYISLDKDVRPEYSFFNGEQLAGWQNHPARSKPAHVSARFYCRGWEVNPINANRGIMFFCDCRVGVWGDRRELA